MKPFLQISYLVLSAKKIKNLQTNEIIDLSCSDKMIYQWMFGRYYHLKSQNKEMFYNEKDMASILDLSTSTIKRTISKFSEAGILEIKKKKIKGFISSNSYIIHDISSYPFDVEFNKNISAIYKKSILSDIQDNKKAISSVDENLPF